MKKTIFSVLTTFLLSPSGIFAQWVQLPGMTQNVNSIYKSGNSLMLGTAAGVMFSTDNGATWNLSTGISGVTKSFTKNANTIFVAGYEKLYSSTDDGASWSALPTIYTNQAVNNVLIKNGSYLAGMNGNGVWYSTNSGATWLAASGISGNNTAIVAKKNLLFASYRNSGNFQSSLNNGVSWSGPAGNGIKIGSSWQNIYTVAVKNDSILVAGTNNGGTFTSYDGAYFSSDNGNNWTKKVNGLTTTAINHIAIVGNLIFAGTDGGGVFYSSDDGDNWSTLNTGLTALTINKLYLDGSTLYAATSSGAFRIEICNLLKNTSTLTNFGAIAINAGDSTKLLVNTSGSNYQLLQNNVGFSSSANNVFYVKQSGDYKVVVEYSSTCKDTTNKISISVVTGIKNIASKQNVVIVYPNPSKDEITIQFEQISSDAFYSIVDQMGRKVLSGKIQANTTTIDVATLPAGVYYVHVNEHKVNGTYKIIKQ